MLQQYSYFKIKYYFVVNSIIALVKSPSASISADSASVRVAFACLETIVMS